MIFPTVHLRREEVSFLCWEDQALQKILNFPCRATMSTAFRFGEIEAYSSW